MREFDVKVPLEERDLFFKLLPTGNEEVMRERPFSPDRRGSTSRQQARNRPRQFLVITIRTDWLKLKRGWRILRRNKR